MAPGQHSPTDDRGEPRWPAIVGLLAAAGLYFALPSRYTFGQPELLAAVVALFVALAVAARWRGHPHLAEQIAYATLILLTAAMAFGLIVLVRALPRHSESPTELLRSAAVLWMTNILVFASWYWRLDAGGPNARDRNRTHRRGAFLFAQMTMHDSETADRDGDGDPDGPAGWRPGFVDYLFLAFNTSTAFSPTDVPVLSRWAKVMMMTQSLISFSTVVLLAARAVNIL